LNSLPFYENIVYQEHGHENWKIHIYGFEHKARNGIEDLWASVPFGNGSEDLWTGVHIGNCLVKALGPVFPLALPRKDLWPYVPSSTTLGW
jgi:hypothetical protein